MRTVPLENKRAQEEQQAYVLHSYPFRETSLIVEIFSRQHGRIALLAKGARRPRSALRGLLLSFQPLQINWLGKSELKTLSKVEWLGVAPALKGLSLICGFYLNELLLRLLPREDPHENLFDYYQQIIAKLAANQDYEPLLRKFEMNMLREIGYALTLDREIETGSVIDPAQSYYYIIQQGPVAASTRNNGLSEPKVAGKTLLDMAAGCFDDPATIQQSKLMMRALIGHYLGSQPLYTRQLLHDFNSL